ncbi:hypothetical protein TWF718_002875 [Orbilia javanica]|uniref:F-box domain-containing protein n=1 Tax=Orbilia javanica TaxID=47235 RepID=A0AAN8R841_9PEZI
MASITSMPMEILDLIAKNLRTRDLGSLRRTCHNLNARLRELHLDAIYHTQRIFMAPLFLKGLINVTKKRNPRDNDRVRVLELSCPESQHVEDINRMLRLSLGNKTDTFRQNVDYLKPIFSIFRNIRTVDFLNRLKKEPSPFEFRVLLLSLETEHQQGVQTSSITHGYKLGCKLLDEAVRIRIWWDALESIASAGVGCITTFGFRNQYPGTAISVSLFDEISVDVMSLLKPGFPHLRQLELYICFDGRDDNPCTGFCQFLEKIGHQLEELFLSGVRNIWGKRRQILFLPTALGLPKLKTLEVQLATFEISNLVGFLQHSRTLSVLKLSGCWFRGTPTAQLSTFKLLKFACDELRDLRRFELQLLYYTNVAWSVSHGTSLPTTLNFEIDGYWSSEETCTGRVTRLSDYGVAMLDDIYVEIKRRPDLSDEERASIFWNSIFNRDFYIESSDESDDSSE